MKPVISISRLSPNPCVAGRWWLSISKGDIEADWIDCLAAGAQKKWPGRVAVLDPAATLISNLRVWENLILPVWKRDGGPFTRFEDEVAAVFDLAGVDQESRAQLVVRLPAMLDKQDKRLVMLLRSVLVGAECVIVEDDLWRELGEINADSAQGRLFDRLKNAPCLIVVGASPVAAGFNDVSVTG